MKIRNFFLIVSLLGILAQPSQPAPKSMQVSSPIISATREVWRNFTNANWIQALTIQENILWAGTDGGVARWDTTTGSYIIYTTVDGLASNYVNAIASDPAGNVWVGTFGYGVSKFDGANWTTYTTADGLAGDWITAIASDPAGNMWVGTAWGCGWKGCSGFGVSKFDGTKWSTPAGAGDLITSLTIDLAGNLWISIWGSGVSKFDGTNWTTYTTAHGLGSNYVNIITSDPSGNLWFGTNGWGVSKFDGAVWTIYTTADGLAGNNISSIAGDPAGNVWMTTDGGVSKFDGINWTTYTEADGLVSNKVNTITSDPSGNLWFATDRGASKFDGTSWTTYINADGLAGNSVGAIASDADGNLWFMTSKGISELYFIRSLNANYASGSPGSFVNLSIDHFPANQNVPVTVNGVQLGNILISSHGTFTFTLSTTNASHGLYIVKVGDRPSVQVRLILDAQQPTRPKEGDYTVIDIPSGIAFTKEFYLPLLRR